MLAKAGETGGVDYYYALIGQYRLKLLLQRPRGRPAPNRQIARQLPKFALQTIRPKGINNALGFLTICW
jgi:hypothetical protein